MNVVFGNDEKSEETHTEYEKICSENFLKQNMMGPNSIAILEELWKDVELKKGMKILDLGCGNGLTSIFLAKEYQATVYAVDL